MAFERMMERSKQPGSEEIAAFIGPPFDEVWAEFDRYLRETYRVEPQPVYSPTSGWSFRYRTSKPLCEVIPEAGAFTVLVVLGAKEAAAALADAATLTDNVRACLEGARAFHDGRWLYIRVQDARDMADIRRLILLKRRPAKKQAAA